MISRWYSYPAGSHTHIDRFLKTTDMQRRSRHTDRDEYAPVINLFTFNELSYQTSFPKTNVAYWVYSFLNLTCWYFLALDRTMLFVLPDVANCEDAIESTINL